jgi:hypothetical protein
VGYVTLDRNSRNQHQRLHTIHGDPLEVVPADNTRPGTFEHRDVQVELEICQRYVWLVNEPASGVVCGAGMNTGSAQAI